jgi:UDP-glucose 4-epimerase
MTPRDHSLTVVVTGAFGNVGMSTVQALGAAGHRVVTLDLPTRRNRRAARLVQRDDARSVWGDIRDFPTVASAVANADAVVHLAAVIPPRSELDPHLTEQVNVGGTRAVVQAVAEAPRRPRLVYSSSLSVYGQTQQKPPPRTVDEAPNPGGHYPRTKVAAEQVIRSSDVNWVILRLAAVLPLRLPLLINPLLFEVPLTDRIEFVHTRDVGYAIARACETPGIEGKTLHIGGGPRCQLYQHEVISRSFDVLGFGTLPEAAFTTTPFHCDWLDTTESQQLFGYQQRTYDDYLEDLRRKYGWRRPLVRTVAPVLRYAMLRTSPYWRNRERSPAAART